jgi:hypothetical protein
MLIELWERLRGFDKWVETEAKIESSNLSEAEVASFRDRSGRDRIDYEWESTCWIRWTDAEGKGHKDFYEVWEGSPLYQLYDGQTVAIRYNPANPDQFYLRGVSESQLMTKLKWRIGPAIFAALLLLMWGLAAYFRSADR